jgi:hypothetical protein
MHTFETDGKCYSVDMMIAYINIYKPKEKTIEIKKFNNIMESKIWGRHPNKYSPNEVIKNPKKYKCDYDRIHNANNKYPIILTNNLIVDGKHRIIHCIINNIETIKFIQFTQRDLNKFLLKKCCETPLHEIIQQFYDKYVKQNDEKNLLRKF